MKSTFFKLICGAGVLGIGLESRGAQIGVDFVGVNGVGADQSVMGAAEVAGIPGFSQANWNSPPVANQQATAIALKDSAGVATTATVTWTTTGNTYDTSNNGGTDTAGNARMMLGYLDTSGTGASTVTVAGLPATINGNYSVVVYYDGENGAANRTGRYSITGATAGNATLYGRDAGGSTFAGTFVQGQTATDPSAGTAVNDNALALNVPAGNYLVFTGISGAGFTLNAFPYTGGDSTFRAPINGIQIISGVVPEPSALAAISLAGLGLLRRRRRGEHSA